MGTIDVFIESDVSRRLSTYLCEIYPYQFEHMERFVRTSISQEEGIEFLKAIENTYPSRYVNRVFLANATSTELPSFFSSVAQDGFIDKDETMVLRVQGHPRALQDQLLAMLEEHVELSPTHFTTVLYVLQIQDVYYYGIFPREFFFRKKAKTFEPVCGAYYKIEEAIQRFNIPVSKTWNVLDIGAAPGGWSQYLCGRTAKVIAVDPANLQIEAPNIVHIRAKFESVIDELGRYAPFDMIVCDMNRDPRESAETMVRASDLLRENGHLLMTSKLIYKSETGKKALVSRTIEILKDAYQIVGVKWLLANSKNERCVYGVRM